MAELERPLSGHARAPEEWRERIQRAAPAVLRDVGIRVRLDHTALVLGDVAGARAPLEGDVTQARRRAHVHAVEAVVGATGVVRERLIEVLYPELRWLDVEQRQ